MNQVMEHHPMVYRANIAAESGDASLRSARGHFDPKLFGDIGQKYFKNDQYYSQMKGGVKVPTWFGISMEAGYENNGGAYLNPERSVPEAGLWYAGLQLDLGNGLIMNQRRAELEKAKLFEAQSEFQRTILRNQLYHDASNAYWKWYFMFETLRVYEDAVKNAEVRFKGIKESAIYGDKPYIDTVEAKILLQNRTVSYLEAQTKFQNAEAQLELYLWGEGIVPIELEGVYPEKSPEEDIGLIETEYSVLNHPYLSINELKLKEKEVELKLKREQLKPDLTLKYNALSEPVGSDLLAEYSISNYTWGASFAYPILSRKARGDVKLSKLKLQDQELTLTYLEAELKYKIEVAKNELELSNQKLFLNQKLAENTQSLFAAEQALFQLGESSVFMINSRENSYLKSSIELINARLGVMVNRNSYLLRRMLFDI